MTNQGSITKSQATEWMIQEGLTDKQFTFHETEEEFVEKAAIILKVKNLEKISMRIQNLLR